MNHSYDCFFKSPLYYFSMPKYILTINIIHSNENHANTGTALVYKTVPIRIIAYSSLVLY